MVNALVRKKMVFSPFWLFRQFEMRENYRRELTVLLSNIIAEKARKINGFKRYGNQ